VFVVILSANFALQQRVHWIVCVCVDALLWTVLQLWQSTEQLPYMAMTSQRNIYTVDQGLPPLQNAPATTFVRHSIHCLSCPDTRFLDARTMVRQLHKARSQRATFVQISTNDGNTIDPLYEALIVPKPTGARNTSDWCPYWMGQQVEPQPVLFALLQEVIGSPVDRYYYIVANMVPPLGPPNASRHSLHGHCARRHLGTQTIRALNLRAII
jgi:hypothetical protein